MPLYEMVIIDKKLNRQCFYNNVYHIQVSSKGIIMIRGYESDGSNYAINTHLEENESIEIREEVDLVAQKDIL